MPGAVPALAIDRTPEHLLAAMTLDEKVGQLSLYSAHVSWGGDPVNPVLAFHSPQARIAEIRAGRVTGIFNLVDGEQIRAMQRVAVGESRLGIPLLFAADVIHGFRTALPVPLAEAASFEPELAGRASAAAAAEAAAQGLHWTFAPGADLCRDARWGRAIESYGEDMLLASRMAAERVRGFQGDDLRDPRRLMATVKHFAAYGGAEAGLDYNTADLSAETLADHYLPPYRAAVDAGAGAVMTAFNTVGGVPATANRTLLTALLRDTWGFDGITVSDYNSDSELIAHGFAETEREAARLCFAAGLDMCMESGLYARHLADLIATGDADLAALDRAVLRVLRAKQALGLFDTPFRGLDPPNTAAAPRALAREVAQRCPVLLKNEGDLLPLKAGTSMALIGPFAREHAHLNGAWAIFADNRSSVNLEQGLCASPEQNGVLVAPGCEVEAPIEGGIAEARRIAAAADIVILALGEGQHMSGESRSRADPSLPEPQLALARAIRDLGKPTVVLLRCGRPLAIPALMELCDALLVTWFLGAETGNAVADLVFGRIAPSGRLPMSFPRHVGQLPIYYARNATGRPPAPNVPRFTTRYLDVAPGPLFPFGFGLSYGRAEYGATRVASETMAWNGALTIACTIRETAGTAIEEVAQLYIRDLAASRVRPVRELRDFRKVPIPAKGEVEISFTVSRETLALPDGTVEPGTFDVWIAANAEAGQPARFVLKAAA
jgi:beta-glucosidase